MQTFRRKQSTKILAIVLFLMGCHANAAEPVAIESGSASFEVGTTVPGIEVKGTSNSISGGATLTREPGTLSIEAIRASLPVKTLTTGMKVRDQHMRKYIFTTPDGQLKDIEFAADQAACNATASNEFTCQVTGNLPIRGVARPFTTRLSVKEQVSGTAASFHASGEGVVKLSDYGIASPTQFGVAANNEVKLRLTFAGKTGAQTAMNGGER
jgi:polyisoprenoid-binding protein YceI